MADLKPCPFCGGDAAIERLGDRRASTIVSCTNCAASLETGETFDHGRDWNTRAAPTVKPLVWEGVWDDWADTPLSDRGCYHVYQRGDGNWCAEFNDERIGTAGSKDDAKEVAQADFARRVTRCLE